MLECLAAIGGPAMIVDQNSLNEALEHAAALDEARRRHPHDEGLRQRLRAAVDRVRRAARALERGGVLVFVLVVLGGLVWRQS